MQKLKRHPLVQFSSSTIEAAITKAGDLIVTALRASGSPYYQEGMSPSVNLKQMEVGGTDHQWTSDTLEDHFRELANAKRDGTFEYARTSVKVSSLDSITISVDEDQFETRVSISASDRDFILLLHGFFDEAAPNSRVEAETLSIPASRPRIFIGHGGTSSAWMELDIHLTRQHSLETVHYESGSRSGHTIRDVLDEMLDEASMAILVMTAEDEQADSTLRARQNVVHEAGLFQGRLGFRRTVVLRESGVAMFSNLDGIQYVPFTNIRETFGDVLGMIRREFGAI